MKGKATAMDVRVRTSAEDLKQYDYSMRVDCHAYGTVNAKSKADAKERINEGQWDDIDIDVEDIVTINEISLSKNQPGTATVTEIVAAPKSSTNDKAADEVREQLNRYKLRVVFTDMPECELCILSGSKGQDMNGETVIACFALGSRPKCPSDGCRRDCPLIKDIQV